MTASTARSVPESRSNRGLPYAIGALLGLLVVLALAAWAHLASLMRELGARNRVEVAMWAHETGRVQTPHTSRRRQPHAETQRPTPFLSGAE